MQSSNFTNPDIHTNVSVGSLQLHLMNFLEYRIFRRNGEMPACKRNRNMMYFPAAHRKKDHRQTFSTRWNRRRWIHRLLFEIFGPETDKYLFMRRDITVKIIWH